MQKALWSLLLALYSITALPQTTFYYCQKNGNETISDRPCATQGAREIKRIDAGNLPPVNTTQGTTQDQQQQADQFWERQKEAEKQKEAEEQRRQKAEENLRLEKQAKEQRCNELFQRRRAIIDRQNRGDSTLLRNLRVKVNIELQEMKCFE